MLVRPVGFSGDDATVRAHPRELAHLADPCGVGRGVRRPRR